MTGQPATQSVTVWQLLADRKVAGVGTMDEIAEGRFTWVQLNISRTARAGAHSGTAKTDPADQTGTHNGPRKLFILIGAFTLAAILGHAGFFIWLASGR